jgi:hypothetical protein
VAVALSQCPGITPTGDSSAALQAAFNLKQPLVVDCLANCVMGTDYTKSIFVPDGSDVTFAPGGQINVDNAGFPAINFLHVAGTWRGTRVKYTGSLGIAPATAGSAWTQGPAKNYLIQNGFNTVFNGVGGTLWEGPTNPCALISVRGASNMVFPGGKIFVDDGVTADRFAPVGFGFDAAYTPGEVCAPGAPLVVPNVNLSGWEFDGVLMGIVGGGSNVQLTNMTRKRYADLQDAAGGNVGGIGCWFAPPHWFYLQGSPANPMKVTGEDWVDLAVFCGNPVRRDHTSGYMHSVKIELVNGSSINRYYSRCLDGALGILANGSLVGGTVKNAVAICDTSIVDLNGKQASTGGLFFPSSHLYPPSDIQMKVRNLAPVWPNGAVPAGVNVDMTVECGM